MPYDSFKHHRRSIRLRGYDYTAPGAYFITIDTHGGLCIFGEIACGVMRLNDFGKIANAEWLKTPSLRPGIALDEFQIMPNHMHGIIVINDDKQPDHIPAIEQFSKPVIGSIPTIVRAYKSAVTYHINRIRNAPGAELWHSNYYEHIIRDIYELSRIRKYIRNNPLQWDIDKT